MAGVAYKRWDADDYVSEAWHVVLTAARDAGVRFTVSDGHRSMALQEQRVKEHGLWSPSNPTGAARPSPTAPHIRANRQDHALDGNLGDLARWLRAHGVHAIFPIPTEPWHMEVGSERELVGLADDLNDPLRGYRNDEKRWIREYDRLLQLKREGHDTLRRKARRVVLRRVMAVRRVSIWRAAKKSGWGLMHRRARWESLKARSG